MELRLRAARTASVLMFVPVVCLGIMEACGGDDASVVNSTSDASVGDATTGVDASPSDSGSLNDTGPVDSGSAQDSGSDASLLGDATPGTIACGATTCDAPADFCCFSNDGGAACMPTGSVGCPGVPYHCDEATDCTAGEICCQQGFNGPLHIPDNVCTAAVTCPRQLCRVPSECESDKCTPQPACHGYDLGLCEADASLVCN